MSPKDNQRRSLAFLIIFFLGFIYIEKVLTPYMQGSLPKKASEVASDSVDASNQGSIRNKESENIDSSESADAIDAESKDESKLDVVLDPNIIRSEGVVKVNTGVAQFEISKKGGRVLSITLNNYKNDWAHDEAQYEMIFNDGHSEFPAGLKLGTENDVSVVYQAELSSGAISTDNVANLSDSLGHLSLKLKGTFPSGQIVEKTFSFVKDSYLFDLKVSAPSSTLSPRLYWTKKVLKGESSLLDPYNFIGFVAYNGDVAQRTAFADMKDLKSKKDLPQSKWVAVGDKYFATAIISGLEKGFDVAHIERTNGNSFMELGEGSSNELSVKIFSGPKSYTLLNELGLELRRLLDLGKTGIISGPLLSFLNIFYKLVGNYGLAIVLLTIVVKLVLYKLNTSQFKQMKAMQSLKPELDKIKENTKDKQQQQAALMELYKKKGVNPLGGCLPVLIQMPVFIGLYSALSLAVELRHAHFGGWVHDLSSPDALMIGGVAVPMLVVLFTLSMLVQQWTTPSTMDPQQKKIMMIMPVFMFFMFKNFPAGLAVYWLTNNLISIGQQQGMHYNDRSGKSGFKITSIVALGVFVLAYIFTLL